jgi:hypothetical protein
MSKNDVVNVPESAANVADGLTAATPATPTTTANHLIDMRTDP